jgi:acetylornithine deacetylase/succinyl-diaminopimelate desuccinylase-like protein
MVLETEEESGSAHLPNLLKAAHEIIGQPDAIVCLDTCVLDYSTLWMTSSFRSHCGLSVTVSGATEGYHSGDVGGVVPETFRVLRTLLNRIDNPMTGVTASEFQSDIPDNV